MQSSLILWIHDALLVTAAVVIRFACISKNAELTIY